MKKLTLVAALCLLAACDRNRSGAEDAVRKVMKDPDSAKFGEFYFNATTKKGCLAVNGRNAMGGYTGEQQAYVQKTDKGWENFGIAPIPIDSCREVFADSKD
jgi:hypothetical protein